MVLTTLWKGPAQVAARRLPWAGPQCPRGGERPRRRRSRSLDFRLPGPAESPRGSCLFLGAPKSPCTSEGQARCFCSTSKYLTAMGFKAACVFVFLSACVHVTPAVPRGTSPHRQSEASFPLPCPPLEGLCWGTGRDRGGSGPPRCPLERARVWQGPDQPGTHWRSQVGLRTCRMALFREGLVRS